MSVIAFPSLHATRRSREAKSANSSAVTPPSAALGSTNSRAQKPDGIELRCHHFNTVLGGKPSSRAKSVAATSRPSLGDQSSITSWNERSFLDMDDCLGQNVLASKPKSSFVIGEYIGQDVRMVPKIPRREVRRGFIQRTREARIRSGYSQSQIAEALAIDQGTYKNYETNRPLPHELVLPFCQITGIGLTELYGPLIMFKIQRKPAK